MDRVDYQSLILQDLVNIHKAGELNLTPWYQRRSVWTSPQKSYLINTLFERKPIPAIYIRHSLDLEKSKSIKEIVDGQQRSRTIISYCNNEFKARHPNHSRKLLYSELTKDEQQKFLLTPIPVGFLLGASDSDVIDIFGRINSISKSLNAQEKRNAAFSGEMKQFCLEQASSRLAFWRNYNIFSATEISRMEEVQFVSDLVFNLLNGLSDFRVSVIDKMYKDNDEEFPDLNITEQRLDHIFDTLVSIRPALLSDSIFSRPPILFSLMLIIDIERSLNSQQIEPIITEIDALFNMDNPTDPELITFKSACIATTQRIAQRRTREAFIRKFI